jgi:competence protein ComEC
MSASHIISKKIGRHTSAWHSTILTGLLMLCIDPRLIYNISFQLSFSAVIGIGLFYQEIDIENKLLEYLYNSILMTISASALTISIIYFYFDRISYVSSIANTLISWLISPQILLTYTAVVIEKVGISVMLTNCMYYFLKFTTNIIINDAILMAKLNKQVSILLDQQ